MAGKLRLGIVGVGGMGGHHALQVMAGNVPGLKLGAVCGHESARSAGFARAGCALPMRGLVGVVLIAISSYHSPR